MVSHGAIHGVGNPIKILETVIEVADVAWNAYEHHHHQEQRDGSPLVSSDCGGEELSRLREENRRLRGLLADNLSLLGRISDFPSINKDCPPDLHARLLRAVDSARFLNLLQAQDHELPKFPQHFDFPFKRISDGDSTMSEVVIDIGDSEPSFWIWVTDDMVPSLVQEPCGIDNDSYIIVSEDQVVDGIAHFMATCILANPKSKTLTPVKLQKTVAKALGDMNDWFRLKKTWHAGKLLYSLSTWGIAFAGLYTHRGVVKAAAKGVGATGKLLLKAL
ncbi:elongation factor isoform X2 [Wolffia australiana]